MTAAFLVGLCLVLVVVRLAIGNPGRPTIVAAIVVGATIGIAQDLVDNGTDVSTTLAAVVERLGSLGGVIAMAAVAFPLRPGPLYTPDGRVNLRKTCGCGKDGTPEAHGWIGDRKGFTCSEIRVMQNQIGQVERRRYVHRGVEHLREAALRRGRAAARRLFGDAQVDELIGADR
jgi:hypothetical protein